MFVCLVGCLFVYLFVCLFVLLGIYSLYLFSLSVRAFVQSFVRGQALVFARSLLADAGLDDAGRIDRAHARALGRQARPEEIAEALAYVAAWTESTAGQARPADSRREEAWQSWCQALLCSNEFAYLD